MKKITQLSLVTCFALSLIACDNASNTPKTTVPPKQKSPSPHKSNSAKIMKPLKHGKTRPIRE
ncbi:hypothetical protein NMU97_03190 [Pasteurella multocida]|nr:hypothetical protein [Pasteurella multocida]